MEKSLPVDTLENKITHLINRTEHLNLENRMLRQKVLELNLRCKELELKNKHAANKIQQVLSQLKIIIGVA